MQYLGLLSYITIFIGALFSSKKQKNKYLIGAIILIYLSLNLLVIGLRPPNAGSDTESYIYNYYLIRNGYDLPLAEIGFQYLLHLFNILNISENNLWPHLTLIFLLIFLYSTKPFNSNERILIFLGLASSTTFFDLETNGIRQGLATAIGLVAIFNFNGLRQLLLISIAFIFHYSAAILVVISIANKFQISKNQTLLKTMAAILGLLLIGFIFGKNIISIENFNFLPIDFIAADKFSSYTESGVKGTFESLSLIGRLAQSLPMIALITISIALPNSSEFRVVYFTTLALSFFYISLASTGYSYRWAYYPHIITIYLLSWFFSSTSTPHRKIKIMRAGLCVIYIIWGSYSVWINGVFSWNN